VGVPVLFVDVTAGLVLTACLLWCAYALSCLLQPDEGTATRLATAAVAALWMLAVAFLLLSAVKLFVRPVSLALWALASFVAHRAALGRGDPVARLRVDAAAIRSWWASVNRAGRIVIAVALFCVAVRVSHGMIAPCMTWDALTYHLYRPAVWAQAHGFVSTAGPDAAGYYSWFPIYGDAVWGWWLQAMRSDVAIAPIAASMWLMVPLACYVCARMLGATPAHATAAGAAVAFVPAAINFSGAVYVDNLSVALYVAGAAFLTRTVANGRTVDAVVASAALAILVGVKGAVVLPACAVGVVVALAYARGLRGRLAVLAVSVPAIVPTLMAWVVTGSPVYPLTVRLGGRVIFQGHPELEYLLYASWMPDRWAADAATRVFGRMFYPWQSMDADFLNLGLGPLLVAPIAALSLGTVWRSKASRAGAAFLILGAALTIASISGHANRGLILWWWGLMGRLVMIAVAAVVVIAAASPSRLAEVCLWACAVAGLPVAWPRGLSRVDVRAGAAVAPAVLITLGVVLAVGWLRPRLRAPLLCGAAIVLVAACTDVRDRFRYQFYEVAAVWKAYDVHPIDNRWTSSWRIWQSLDADAPLTIAVSAGWDGIGHNWYRYPLLGRRLQNHLLYVPITTDGSLVDYGRPGPDAPISCDAWLARLLASNADFFLALPPLPPENEWARALPQIFQPKITITPLQTTLYRIDRTSKLTSCRAAGMKNR
jgi:hypothetical protein